MRVSDDVARIVDCLGRGEVVRLGVDEVASRKVLNSKLDLEEITQSH